MDWKLELIVVPVSNVDRSKAFYSEKLGFNVDVDHAPNDEFRVVQLTPPGSACSVTIGTGISGGMPPGCMKGLHLVVADIVAAREQLVSRGVNVSEPVYYDMSGQQQPGLHPQRADYGTFLTLDDPDGNTWLVQEVQSRAKSA